MMDIKEALCIQNMQISTRPKLWASAIRPMIDENRMMRCMSQRTGCGAVCTLSYAIVMIGMSSSKARATIMMAVKGLKPNARLASTTTNMMSRVMAMR